MGRTYRIIDGVRRAKAAELAGQKTIWAEVGESRLERKIPVRSLPSPNVVIDLRESDQRERWLNIKEGMAEEPDLFPPITIRRSSGGFPLAMVQIIGE
jgi:ParB-like chromosome segregation protein Spo0J